MGFQIAQNQEIWFDAYRLTTTLNSVAVELTGDPKETSTLGSSWKTFLAGLKSGRVQLEGYMDPQASDSPLFTAFNASGKVITVANAATAGARAYFFKAIEADYQPLKSSIGEVNGFSAGGNASDGVIVRGSILENLSAITSTGDGTALQAGAVAADETLYLGIHVLAVDDPADQLDLVLESDSADDFSGGETTRITVPTISAPGSYFLSVSGAITDDWWRLTHAVSGSTPSFSWVATIGIL